MPVLNLPEDTFICEGEQVQIFGESSSTISWTPSASLSCSLCNDPVANPAATTLYAGSVSNGTCTRYDSIEVAVKALPLSTLTPDTSICFGSSLYLAADTGYIYSIFPDAYLNCNPCTIPISTPDSSTVYSVLILDSFCSVMDTVEITVNYNDVVVAGSNDSICSGETVHLFAEGASDYSWTPQSSLNDPHVSNPAATPHQTTEYIVEGSDACGISFDTVTIVVGHKPMVTVDYDSVIYCNSGTEINLYGQQYYLYNWLNADVENPAATSVFVNPATNTIYQVHISDNGCDTLLNIPVILSDLQSMIVPNAFSPNGDGKNDLFNLLGYCPVTLSYFRIFNRWGQLVFQTSDINKGWDGNFKNEACPLGVYVYAISFTEPNGKSSLLKGNVTLIR